MHRQLTEDDEMIEKLPAIPSLLHGSMPEKQRQSIIKAFMAGEIKTLVCTDLASRGLDTIQVSQCRFELLDALGWSCDHV